MLPVLFRASTEFAGAEGENCVGPFDGPAHTGLFQPSSGDGFAAGLNDARSEMRPWVSCVIMGTPIPSTATYIMGTGWI